MKVNYLAEAGYFKNISKIKAEQDSKKSQDNLTRTVSSVSDYFIKQFNLYLNDFCGKREDPNNITFITLADRIAKVFACNGRSVGAKKIKITAIHPTKVTKNSAGGHTYHCIVDCTFEGSKSNIGGWSYNDDVKYIPGDAEIDRSFIDSTDVVFQDLKTYINDSFTNCLLYKQEGGSLKRTSGAVIELANKLGINLQDDNIEIEKINVSLTKSGKYSDYFVFNVKFNKISEGEYVMKFADRSKLNGSVSYNDLPSYSAILDKGLDDFYYTNEEIQKVFNSIFELFEFKTNKKLLLSYRTFGSELESKPKTENMIDSMIGVAKENWYIIGDVFLDIRDQLKGEYGNRYDDGDFDDETEAKAAYREDLYTLEDIKTFMQDDIDRLKNSLENNNWRLIKFFSKYNYHEVDKSSGKIQFNDKFLETPEPASEDNSLMLVFADDLPVGNWFRPLYYEKAAQEGHIIYDSIFLSENGDGALRTSTSHGKYYYSSTFHNKEDRVYYHTNAQMYSVYSITGNYDAIYDEFAYNVSNQIHNDRHERNKYSLIYNFFG